MTKQEIPVIKKQLSSFDICALVAEFQILIGGRIEKTFHYKASPMEFQMRVNLLQGKKEIRVEVGKWLFLSDQELVRPSENAEQLTVFAKILRSQLENGKIIKIEQHEFDRIIEFTVAVGKKRFVIIFEMFGNGNITLTESGNIVSVLTNMAMKDRSLKSGLPYIYPPNRINIKTLSRNSFGDILKRSENELVRTLALELNLGGIYAEELCLRVEIDKKSKSSSLADMDIDRLYSSLSFLLEKCKSGGYGEIVLNDRREPINLQPWSLKVYDNQPKIRTWSFNECVSRYHDMQGTVSESEKKLRMEMEKLKRKLDQQRLAIPEIEHQIELNRKIADSLFDKANLIERVIIQLNRAKKDKNLSTVAETLCAQKLIESVDISDLSFKINMKIDGVDVPVSIDSNKNFHENVAIYYNKSKEQREKLDGAKVAFQSTLKQIDEISKKALEKQIIHNVKHQGKVNWFENYRWFISSDGTIVVAGRDSHSNDTVVKKYLKEGDLYVHAEIHGAPSVVVKKEKGTNEISEQTLKESCEFALSFSKAWNMKLSHGSAYWVTPDQVSKTPNSGEFVPHGGFIIRGKKTFFEVDVQCAIGEIEYENSLIIMSGPVSALKSRSKRYVILRPGDVEKNDVAKELAKLFGANLEFMQRLLPPGEAKIIEKIGFSTQK